LQIEPKARKIRKIMNKSFRRIFIGLFISALLSFPSWSSAQLILGQYEEEAPFGTWNTFSLTSAATLARGDVSFTLASDSTVALSNPALLVLLPKWTVTVNSSFHQASFFKYAFVNTGVMTSNENLTLGLYALDFGGLSFRWNNWAIAAGFSIAENYDRPPLDYQYSYGGSLQYQLKFTQGGILRNLNFSVSHRLGSRFSAGLGFNYVTGSLEREVFEQTSPGITITDRKTQDFHGFYLNGGIFFALTESLRLAAVFRTPYLKKAKNESSLRYSAPAGKTDITIEASSLDSAKQPLIIGIGASYQISSQMTLAVDLSYYNWTTYSFECFGEKLERNFKDLIKINAGAEYLSATDLFGVHFDVPFRVGIIYDPQPMKEPNSAYINFTFGLGLYWKGLHLDLGTLFGREFGSGDNLSARKITLSLGLHI
jgi:long-subunit fatty acid transport protein